MPINVQKFSLPPMDNNCYVIYNSDSKKAVIIDAPDNILPVINFINLQSLNPLYICLTHGHYDHIGGLDALKKNFPNAKIVISKKCEYMLKSEEASLGISSPFFTQPLSNADVLVDDGDVINFDDNTIIKVHMVNGHTSGDVVYEMKNYLFTGDTLFAGDIGRADLPGGDLGLLVENIKKLVFSSNENSKICPGHGPDSTVIHEKRFNRYLR